MLIFVGIRIYLHLEDVVYQRYDHLQDRLLDEDRRPFRSPLGQNMKAVIRTRGWTKICITLMEIDQYLLALLRIKMLICLLLLLRGPLYRPK